MIIVNKKNFFLTLLVFSFILSVSSCRKHVPGYNPYLHSKPTVKQQKANAKALEEGAKKYRKSQRKTRRRMYGGKPVDKPAK